MLAALPCARRLGSAGFVVLTAALPASWAEAAQKETAASRHAAYSVEQAAAGADFYGDVCAACHLSDLTGSFEAT